jgi:hypothetical protein
MGRLLLAEWTKLASVPRWVAAIMAAVVLTVLVGLLGAASSTSDANRHWDFAVGPDGRSVRDDFHLAHRPLAGDGSVTARVASQAGLVGELQDWARAGVILKEGLEPGSRYAAMMVTPGHGVRFQANFADEVAGGGTGARWLRLTRSGSVVDGYESADGTAWRRVGTVDLAGLPSTVQVGLFVASPDAVQVTRQFGSVGIGGHPTAATATFDNVRVEPTGSPPGASWTDRDVGRPALEGDATEHAGGFTVSGSGDLAVVPPEDDVVRLSLTGVLVGLMAVVGLGVLSITSEYKRGMIRTTFAASPRRGRVLAAKALVLGGATFVAGLVACLAAFLLAQPTLRANGYGPPAFPRASLTDGPVLRAVIGSAAVLALVAVLGLAAGAILRRSAGAITAVIVLLVLPQLVAAALPVSAGRWLQRLTPSAGFAIQQTVERGLCLPEDGCFPEGPWLGFGVLCAYVAVALAVAFWLLRRRDA